MASKVFLLRHGPYELPANAINPDTWAKYILPDYQHFVGCPYSGPNQHNLDKARTFKTAAAARATNEFKYDGYEVVEAEVTVTLL